MSPQLKPGGYGHRIQKINADHYRLFWAWDTKYRRMRYPRTISRDTDEAGAKRFAARWSVPLPA
jgi:hypothetical protein